MSDDIDLPVALPQVIQSSADMAFPFRRAVLAKVPDASAMPRQEEVMHRHLRRKRCGIFVKEPRRGVDAMHEEHGLLRAGNDALVLAVHGFRLLHTLAKADLAAHGGIAPFSERADTQLRPKPQQTRGRFTKMQSTR